MGEPASECTGLGECPVAGAHTLYVDLDAIVGIPRIWEDLRYTGERCGRHRVARLMRRAGAAGRAATVGMAEEEALWVPSQWYPQLSRSELPGGSPNTQWGTDITYIRTAEHS